MTPREWIGLYACGAMLGLWCWFTRRGDFVTHEKHPWIGFAVTVIGWPLLLPFSAYALAGNVVYMLTGKLIPGMEVESR